jgi:hypothetical protein
MFELRHVSHKRLEIKYAHKTIINTNEIWPWSSFIGSKGRLGCGPTSSLEEGIEKRK